MLRWSCDTEIRTTVVASGTAFFRAWKRRHGRGVRLKLAPSSDGTVWYLVATVPHKRLEHGAADCELSTLVGDYRPESFTEEPTEHTARRAARRADGYDAETDVETVSAAAARFARVSPLMRAKA
jgi:hypothetical protein